MAITVNAVWNPTPPLTKAPDIGTPSVPESQATLYSAKVWVTVTWYYNPSMRIVKISVKGSWHQMTKSGDQFYYEVTDLQPDQSYGYSIRATAYYWDPTIGDYVSRTKISSGHTIRSCKPIISMSFENEQSEQVDCVWSVSNWGRTGRGVTPYATIEYAYFYGSEWTSPYSELFDGNSGSYTITNLIMSTKYLVRLKVTHYVDFVPVSSDTQTQDVTTESWSPANKYAIILDLTGLVDDDAYIAHMKAWNDMKTAVSQSGFQSNKTHSLVLDAGATPEHFVGNLTWFSPTDQDFVFVYIVGHGSALAIPHLCLCKTTKNFYTDVDSNVISDALNSITCAKMVLIIEACDSGSLLASNPEYSILGEDRLVIVASDADSLAWIDEPGTGNDFCVFSDSLIENLADGFSFFNSFFLACEACWESDVGPYQNPRLDDFQNDVYGSGYHESPLIDFEVGNDGLLALALTLDI